MRRWRRLWFKSVIRHFAYPFLEANRRETNIYAGCTSLTTRHQHRLTLTIGRLHEGVTFTNIDTDVRLARYVGVALVLDVERAVLVVSATVDL
jgi:hypothetical protein